MKINTILIVKYQETTSFDILVDNPTSFTLSYKVAKYYYDLNLGFPMLYRVTIMKGCNALFISNNYNDNDNNRRYDFEIIIPSYSIVSKSSVSSNDYLGINKNDKDNYYDICANNTKKY